MPNELWARAGSGAPKPTFNSNWVEDVESPDMREAVRVRVTEPNEERARMVARSAGAYRKTPKRSSRR